jgi:cardiolipin synthase
VIFNLPNGLTFLRLILTPVIVMLLLDGAFFWAFLVFLLAGVTDGLDGFLARSLREPTEFGKILDPLADKILLGSSFITLAFLWRLPIWLAGIVVGRDLVLMIGSCILYMVTGRFGYPPSLIGKLSTVLQVLTVLAVMVMAEGDVRLHPLFWGTAAVSVVSGLGYVYRGTAELFARLRNASAA